MAEKEIRGGICHGIHRYAKPHDKCMKKYDKNTASSYLIYLDANNLYGWAMSEKLPANGFEWVEELSRFNKDFITNCDENINEGYFFKVDAEYPKNCQWTCIQSS